MGVEKRRHSRTASDLMVLIEMADCRIAGRLSDISDGGACLRVANTQNLPEQFTVHLSEHTRRWVRVAWRSARNVGLQFIEVPRPSTGGHERRIVQIKCPRTGKNITTGLQVSTDADLDRISTVTRFTQCQYCKVVHGWTPSKAFVVPCVSGDKAFGRR